MAPISPELNPFITRFRVSCSSVNCEYELQVTKDEEIKQQLADICRQRSNTAFE